MPQSTHVGVERISPWALSSMQTQAPRSHSSARPARRCHREVQTTIVPLPDWVRLGPQDSCGDVS